MLIISKGASLADITNAAENNYIKNVLKAVQAQDGTDYFIGGVDAARNKQFKWLNGKSLFNEFRNRANMLLRLGRYLFWATLYKIFYDTLILTILVILSAI